jgi:hypothetical protein
MILLVTASSRASESAAALYEATAEEVVACESLARAAALLRADAYRAVVLDQYLLEAAPHEAETVLAHLGSAVPVQVNLAISGLPRLQREVRAALRRRQREERTAHATAAARLRRELNGTLTALLLSAELARATAGLPPAAAEKLESILQLVARLRSQLHSPAPPEADAAVTTPAAPIPADAPNHPGDTESGLSHSGRRAGNASA